VCPVLNEQSRWLKSGRGRAEDANMSTVGDVTSLGELVRERTDTAHAVGRGSVTTLAPPSDHDISVLRHSSIEPAATVLSDSAQLALLDAMPVAVLLIDRHAVVRFANLQTAEMLGVARNGIYGRSVLDFVLIDDLDFAADLLDTGSRYSGEIMGPSRMRYLDAAGVSHWTQVWAHDAPAEMGVDGYILTLTRESVRDVLVSAVNSLAMDNELDRNLAAVALSARAVPIRGIGVILLVEESASDDGTRFRHVGPWPIDLAAVNAYGTPWRRALVEATDADVDDIAASGLTPGARDALLAAGAKALFVRPIRDIGNEIVGVYVVFRPEHGPASMNQNDHLHDAVRLASLAFAQLRRRDEIESAAHTDALTGIANRTAFNERLETDRRQADVLYVDLDHFKSVNDTFGHQIGDLVVVEAAQRISAALRRADMVYRTGGDEFIVVCGPTGDDPAQRIALAQRIIERLMAPFDVADHRVRIGATVGISRALDTGLSATVRAADAALHTAKERGRSGWFHAI
jgi:diguanylate cyclase (GGDEF)-like protein